MCGVVGKFDRAGLLTLLRAQLDNVHPIASVLNGTIIMSCI